MIKIFARTSVGAAVAFSVACAAVAGQGDVPSKDDIIKALMSKDTSTSRGFVQVTGAGVAKPVTAPPTETVAYTKPDHAATSGHAVPASAPGAAVPHAPAPAAASHASIGVPILFEKNSATISPASRAALENIGAALRSSDLQSSHILLEGHTDGSGSAETNLQLSEQRAAAVRDFLIQTAGVPADRLSSVGKGSTELADPANPTAPENRRVVLVNLSN